jgi:hypothetical protein
MIDWCHVEAAFKKSLQYVDPSFLEATPRGSHYRVRTMLKNVVINGVIIFVKHLEHIEFVLEKDAELQLYHLDMLTPAPAFVGPERPQTHIPGNKRRKTERSHNPLHIQLVDSDGELEDVDLTPS